MKPYNGVAGFVTDSSNIWHVILVNMITSNRHRKGYSSVPGFKVITKILGGGLNIPSSFTGLRKTEGPLQSPCEFGGGGIR